MLLSDNVEKVARFLGERAGEGPVGVLLLVDRFLETAVDLNLFVARGCKVVEVPLAHPACFASNTTPVLIQVRAQDTDLLGLSASAAVAEQEDPVVEAANGLSISGWIETFDEPEVVAQHLSRVMVHRGASFKGRRLLRLSDRRVMEFAWTLLHGELRRALLGPIVSWHAVNRCDQIVTYQAAHEPAKSELLSESRLSLNEEHWSDLSQCQLVQEMTRGWKRIAPSLPVDYLHQARGAVSGATQLGLSVGQDVLLFAAYTLQIHPSLHRHRLVAELVQRSLMENIPLINVLGEVPDPDGWDAIKKELDSQDVDGVHFSSPYQ